MHGHGKFVAFAVTVLVIATMLGSQAFTPIFNGGGSSNGDLTNSDPMTVDVPEVPQVQPEDAPATPVPDEPQTPPEDPDDDAIILDNVTINSPSGPAISVEEGATVKYLIKGTCTITSADSDAIYVPLGSTLTIKGFDANSSLTVIGATDDGAGSGIGAHGNSGTINIINLANLSATGNGVHAYGIGGDKATVTIKNTHISSAFGGQLQTKNDSYLSKYITSHGSGDTEGGPAIGGLDVTVDGSTIDLAVGGSKAAGIGARHWSAVSVSIKDSTIGQVYGGCSAAAIGGSRFASDSAFQTIDVIIDNSDITAFGGIEAAGIGSGYDSNCNYTQGECHIEITNHSRISAKGGDYAAGIGTGLHHGNLTGFIDATVDISDVHRGDKYHYKDIYSDAQDIGYGVIDGSNHYSDHRNGNYVKDTGVHFTVAGETIAVPTGLYQ